LACDSQRLGLADQLTNWILERPISLHCGPLTAGPIASLQYTDVGIDSFSEKGSLAPLAIHSGSAESLRSDVGFRAFYQWQIGKILVEPSLKAAWEHEYKYSVVLPDNEGAFMVEEAIQNVGRLASVSRNDLGVERRKPVGPQFHALEAALTPMDPETGAGQASARCSAMKASSWAATWTGKGAMRRALRSA